MGKILVIGSLNIDMVMKVDHMPTAGETILCDGWKHVARVAKVRIKPVQPEDLVRT